MYELPRCLSGEESVYSAGAAGDKDSIPGSGRSPGGGHSNPLRYSERGAWWAMVHRVAELERTEVT